MTTQEEMNKRIIDAAAKENVGTLRDCITNGADVNCKNSDDQAPLHIAVEKDNADAVQLLLEKGAFLSVVNRESQKPLHLAAWKGNPKVVRLLLEKDSGLCAQNCMGQTPLHLAARYANKDVVTLLSTSKEALSIHDNTGQTPLHIAARYAQKDVVTFLSTSKEALSKQDNTGQTPLHIAARYAQKDVVTILSTSKDALSKKDKTDQTPLHIAAMESEKGVVELLITKGASLHVVTKKGQTPLHLAVMHAREDVVDFLIQSGASPSDKDKKGQTPLHHAAGGNTTAVIDLLLKANKASLDEKDINGNTPLHIAASGSNSTIVDHLLRNDASLSAENKTNQTPLHNAALEGSSKVVDILLKANANTSVKDEWDQTPLHIAAVRGNLYIVNLLINTKALLDVVNSKNETPLHLAVGRDYTTIVERLLKGKASLDKKNLEGKTPLHIAQERGNAEIVDLLTKAKPLLDVVNSKENKMYKGMASKTEEIVDEMNQISYGHCVYLGGVFNVGKSTLASILIGEEMSQHWKSTDGLNNYFGRIGIDLISKEIVPLKQATIQEDIKQEIRNRTYKMEIVPLDIVDIGGQMSFDMPHQLFMGQKGTFVLMFDGRIDFSVPLKGYPQKETTESILKHWVTSILSYCEDDEDLLPMVMFSATHRDGVNEEDRKKKKKQLIQDLGKIFKNHKRQHRIIYDDIFFINGNDKNDLEINNLKSKLVELACKQNPCGKQMHMKWVPLDLQLSELRLHNMNIISEEELITLNRRNEDLELTDEHIRYFLNDQHSLGKILYFDQHGLDNFIIVQPQSLVNILSSFITAPNFWPMDNGLKGILCTNTVQITKQDLLKLWTQRKFHQYMPNDDFKEFIIQVLVHLSILVEMKHNRQGRVQSYLVPCIGKHRLPVTDFYLKSVDKMICLSYTLLKSSIPAALFSKLIGTAINAWSLKETPDGICLYHQAAILCIDESNELHLLVEDDTVFVYLRNRDTKCFISPNIASIVQEYITLTMQKVLSLSTSEVPKALEMKIGEWCTSDGGCYISVPTVEDGGKWICENNKEHNTKYPLYWILDKKQYHCDANCAGLDKIQLALCPQDKHLFRLASIITLEECRYVVSILGLSITTCDFILDFDRHTYTVRKFLALWKCNELRHKQCATLSFKDLADALSEKCNTHVLCQLFMEDVTIYEIASIILQEIPEDDVLQQVSNNVGDCAMHLGVELGLSMAAIEEIHFRYPKSMFRQTFGVMEKWKKSSIVRPTIRMLMKAFQSADPRGVHFLKKKYSV